MTIASSSTDTFADLATKAKLDIADISKWLRWSVGKEDRPVNPGGAPDPCHLYTIPNTVYVNRVEVYEPWWLAWEWRENKVLRSQGFNVVVASGINDDDLNKQLADPNVYGIDVLAHADSGFKGEFSGADTYHETPAGALSHLDHKLGGFKAIWCWSGVMQWRPLVSPNGFFYSYPVKFIFGVPSLGGWEDSNMDSNRSLNKLLFFALLTCCFFIACLMLGMGTPPAYYVGLFDWNANLRSADFLILGKGRMGADLEIAIRYFCCNRCSGFGATINGRASSVGLNVAVHHFQVGTRYPLKGQGILR